MYWLHVSYGRVFPSSTSHTNRTNEWSIKSKNSFLLWFIKESDWSRSFVMKVYEIQKWVNMVWSQNYCELRIHQVQQKRKWNKNGIVHETAFSFSLLLWFIKEHYRSRSFVTKVFEIWKWVNMVWSQNYHELRICQVQWKRKWNKNGCENETAFPFSFLLWFIKEIYGSRSFVVKVHDIWKWVNMVWSQKECTLK